MTFPRTLSRFALEASTVFPVLLVTGARQVGKTTLPLGRGVTAVPVGCL